MIAVLLWELKRRRMFTLWWTVGIIALVAVTILSYSAFKEQSATLDEALSGAGDSIGAFVGGSDLFSEIGYLNSQIYYITLPLLLIIMVMTLSSSLMARDENDLTVELTLARPVSRSGVLLGKALAGLVIMAIVAVVSYLVTWWSAEAVGIHVAQRDLLLTHFITFAFSISFGAISFAFIAFGGLLRRIASIFAIMLSFGGYILTSLSAFVDWLEPIAKAMPYHYFDTMNILQGTIDKGIVIYLMGVFAGAAVLAWVGYTRRDIG